MSKQLSLFNFGIKGTNNATQKRPVKGRKVSQDEYEAKRSRHFVPSWEEKYPGIYEENNLLYCKPCKQYPDNSDPASALVLGKSSFRTGGLEAHWKSAQHLTCAAKYNAALARAANEPPLEGPMDNIIRAMNEQQKILIKKLFNTVYFSMKYEEPYSALPRLLSLQKKNGSDIAKLTSYNSAQACRR